jgi:NCS1 family nucleobase:cation symporter-1
MGGGVLGGLALLAIGLAAAGSNAMNDYSGSLALQTVGADLAYFVALIATATVYRCALWLTPAKSGEATLKPR